MKRIRQALDQRGFTLIELLVVIAIIGVLILLGAPNYRSATTDAKVGTDQANVKAINTALVLFALQNGACPVSLSTMITDSKYFPDGPPVDPWDGIAADVVKDGDDYEATYDLALCRVKMVGTAPGPNHTSSTGAGHD